jgi:hypothetical protein
MDSPGALSSDDRAALAAWADEGDLPEGFADRVVVAFLAEAAGDVNRADAYEAVVPIEPRATVGGGKLLRLVGFVAAIAAAAAVMLMVRVLPRASEVEVVSAHACEHAGAKAAPTPTDPPIAAGPSLRAPELAVLGAQAATVLAQHCSPCHDSTDPDANPSALQVFDLEQPQWWLTMSDAQLEQARTRVQELGAASDDERARVKAFVQAQLQQPAHAG